MGGKKKKDHLGAYEQESVVAADRKVRKKSAAAATPALRALSL